VSRREISFPLLGVGGHAVLLVVLDVVPEPSHQGLLPAPESERRRPCPALEQRHAISRLVPVSKEPIDVGELNGALGQPSSLAGNPQRDVVSSLTIRRSSDPEMIRSLRFAIVEQRLPGGPARQSHRPHSCRPASQA
jgi:hypothetical protein